MSVYEKIAELGITLPEVTPAVAAYVPFVRSGQQIFLSGHIAKKDGKPWAGKLGRDLSTDAGVQAARGTAVDLRATLHLALGDLNKIKRILKLMVLVNSAPTRNNILSLTAPRNCLPKCSETRASMPAAPLEWPRYHSGHASKST